MNIAASQFLKMPAGTVTLVRSPFNLLGLRPVEVEV